MTNFFTFCTHHAHNLLHSHTDKHIQSHSLHLNHLFSLPWFLDRAFRWSLEERHASSANLILKAQPSLQACTQRETPLWRSCLLSLPCAFPLTTHIQKTFLCHLLKQTFSCWEMFVTCSYDCHTNDTRCLHRFRIIATFPPFEHLLISWITEKITTCVMSKRFCHKNGF